jgi:hypothetical protein
MQDITVNSECGILHVACVGAFTKLAKVWHPSLKAVTAAVGPSPSATTVSVTPSKAAGSESESSGTETGPVVGELALSIFRGSGI